MIVTTTEMIIFIMAIAHFQDAAPAFAETVILQLG